MVIIDPTVSDYQSLAAGVRPNTEVHILDPNRDGIEQITEILTDRQIPRLSSLHLISHGATGTLYLGNNTLELSNIEQYRPQLQKWNIPHLYIYGCEVAAGDAGTEFLTKLHQITQAEIYANPYLTGNPAKGGTWNLQPPVSPSRRSVSEAEPRLPIPFSPETLATYQGILGASDLDTSFGTGGKVTTDIAGDHETVYDITIDSLGKILVAGDIYNGSNLDFALARYNPDGSLDTTFGTGGIVTTDIAGDDETVYDITIDSLGKILVAGDIYNGISSSDFALARYNPDGTLDTAFGTGGKVTTDFGGNYDFGRAITIDSSGKILVAGQTFNVNNFYYDFALARYNPDGTLDTTFGTGGKVRTDFSGGEDIGYGITIDSSGKILVAGLAYNVSNSNDDFGLARYNPDGTLDTAFGTGGKVTTDFVGDYDFGHAITIDSSGKILVAGQTLNVSNSNYDFALARYGTPDITVTTPAVAAATVGPSNTNQLLYQINLAVTEVNATLTGLTLTTGGTYQTTDVSNFKLWYSTDSTFDAATDTQLSSQAPVATGGSLAFTGLTQNITRNTTGYLFITIDIAASASGTGTISLAAPSLTNITFDSGTPTGTPTASSSLTIDALAPAAPTITTTGTTNDNTPTITGTAEANSTVNILQNGTSIGTATADATGNWTFTPTTAITDSTYNFTATATDAAGNTSTASTASSLTIDTTAPAAPTITTTGTTNDNTPTITGTAEANSTVNILQNGTSIGTATADASGNWTFAVTTTLTDGTYNFTATATDAAGNTPLLLLPVA